MNSQGLSERDLQTLAGITGTTAEGLAAELRRRPWAIHDLFADPDVLDTVLDRHAHPANVVSPFLLFSVLAHAAAAELREATYVSDWAGMRTRLPVFDVEPVHEFLEDAGRLSFLAGLLASYVAPRPAPVPADPLDIESLAAWLDQATPTDRVLLLRQLGDLALFLTGVFPDRTGPQVIAPTLAERLGSSVEMTSEEILALCDRGSIAPGIEALETLGSRWYTAAAQEDLSTPAVVIDVAHRFRSARRVLNHLSDRWLYEVDLNWGSAA
jgi:hypothetical protein